MIVDASAILCILLKEEEQKLFDDRITEAREQISISAIGLWEVCAKLNREVKDSGQIGMDYIAAKSIEVVPVNLEQTELAIEAHRRFGRNNHPAKLNLGDCFAYALAKSRAEPLLFKGNDFSQTDIEAAA